MQMQTKTKTQMYIIFSLFLFFFNLNKMANSLNIIVQPTLLEPKCSNCKWNIPNNNGIEEFSLCKLYNKKFSFANKEITIYNYALCSRQNDNLCGMKGVGFEEKTNSNMDILDFTLDDLNKLIKKLIIEQTEVKDSQGFSEGIEENEIKEYEKKIIDYDKKIKKLTKILQNIKVDNNKE